MTDFEKDQDNRRTAPVRKESLGQRYRAKSTGRGALKALAVIVAMLALVGSVASIVVGFSDDIVKRIGVNGGKIDDAVLLRRYGDQSRNQPPQVVGEELMKDSVQQIDIEPFVQRSPWSTVRLSMMLRLVSYFLVVLGACLTMASRPLGPRLMIIGSLILVVHGLVESLALVEHGQAMVSELYRDLRISYEDVVERAQIEGEFRQPFPRFREREPKVLKIMGMVYFLVTSVLWQLAAVCLAASQPLQPKLAIDDDEKVEK